MNSLMFCGFSTQLFIFLAFIYKTTYGINISNVVLYLYVQGSPQRAVSIFTFLSPVSSFSLGVYIS